MKSIKRYLLRNWYVVVSGCVAMGLAVMYAYLERGYFGFGGEWMVLPVFVFGVEILREAGTELREILEEIQEAEDE